MAHVYDNWERLVRAILRMEDLRYTGERTPSDVSAISLLSSSFNLSSTASSPLRPISSFNFSTLLLSAAGEAFEYAEILAATGYLSKSNLIKRGRSGDLFRGSLRDSTPVVVKRIDLSSSVEKQARLITELGVLGKVSHSRLVPLLGYCMENGINDDKYLVYKYMPYKDLSSFQGLEGDDESSQSLDFVRRMKIAIGAAEGLCYLHEECNPPLVHRDIQASSILLDDRFEVRLGSLSEVYAQKRETTESRQNIISRFLRLPQRRSSNQGTSGTPEATWADDVYCFGKVLLQLVTGKLGISASSEAAMKVWLEQTLPYISIYDKELVTKIIDPSLFIDEDLLEEAWAVAIVARSCLNPRPSMRPLMRYVLKALENPHEVVREPTSSSHEIEEGEVLLPQQATRNPVFSNMD
ncbi:probable LRR receptor-like serine/threonine-protein kinase At2g16250 [Coffea eugenioides]|uniref:probable LRR receptor-like serine/threonine-protein kinase At2g16250 n=1 Tax=Coffea eugenioides TaxID=49369 RepID=UPI000F60F5A4|nr:probable LRR receptor-like serine/threonine-protein kinase At2g16250 [Coffea eugenioides]